jgi:hypothetical protein
MAKTKDKMKAIKTSKKDEIWTDEEAHDFFFGGALNPGAVVKIKKDIREFSTGAIRDTEDDKEDYIETISWTAMRRYAQYMTGKKKKYGEGNFKKGIPIDAYERSLLRHIQKYLANKHEGQNIEKEEDHLSAILFNCFGIIHEEQRNEK